MHRFFNSGVSVLRDWSELNSFFQKKKEYSMQEKKHLEKFKKYKNITKMPIN